MKIEAAKQDSWLTMPVRTLLGMAFLVVALLALACSPAEEAADTSAPAAVAPTAAPAEEAEEETALVASDVVVPSSEGKFVDQAGLQVFVPDGYLAGGPKIPPDPRTPQYGGTFRRADGGDPPSLDPYHTSSYLMLIPTSTVYERLVHFKTAPGTDIYTNTLGPGLAESWEWSDDFLTLTFKLRQGVYYHNVAPVNGREMDSGDVVSTYELYSGPESLLKGVFTSVDSVTAPDKYTAVYHFNTVDPTMINILSESGKGYILPRELGEGSTFNRRLGAIGTGAFMVSGEYEYKLGLSHVRNPNYWVKDADGNNFPYLDGLQQRVIPDASARTAAFRTGKIDVGATISSPQQMRDILRTNPDVVVQERVGVQSLVGMGFRLDKAPYDDVRVRRAMALAIDFEEWAQTLYEIPASPVPMINGYWVGEGNSPDDLGEWFQGPDVARAKALLAEAGYADGFTQKLEYYAYGQAHTETMELMDSYWREIGIETNIESQDYTVFRPDVDKGTWTDIHGWQFYYPFPSETDSLMKALQPGGHGNSQTGHVNDPKLTALVDDFLGAYGDPDRKQALLVEIRNYTLDQVFEIPWQYGHLYTVVSPRIRNFQYANHAILSNDNRTFMHAWIDDSWS